MGSHIQSRIPPTPPWGLLSISFFQGLLFFGLRARVQSLFFGMSFYSPLFYAFGCVFGAFGTHFGDLGLSKTYEFLR